MVFDWPGRFGGLSTREDFILEGRVVDGWEFMKMKSIFFPKVLFVILMSD